MGNKTYDFSSKKRDFLPKNDQIWLEIGCFVHIGPGLAGSFGALLVDWLVVVAHGLYLARHLFTLFVDPTKAYLKFDIFNLVNSRSLDHFSWK